MAPRTRRTRLIDRDLQHRDAWLCVIATEGAQTEPAYFNELKLRRLINLSRVQLVPLPTPHCGESAGGHDGPDPAHVLDRLIKYEEVNRLLDGDQRWLVLDLDHHRAGPHRRNLHQVVHEAKRRGYHVAISNPCFEVWLLLHFPAQEVHTLAPEPKAMKAALRQIRESLGAHFDASLYDRGAMDAAIARGQALDSDPDAPWPPPCGTRVYRLISSLPPP